MSQNRLHDDEPLLPPAEPDAEQNLWRWVLATVLVVVIVFLAFQAYRWLATDVERRRAVAAGAAPQGDGMVSEAVQHDAQQPAAAAPPAGAAPATAAGAGEPVAPAVTGQAIYKCVDNGQVTYTNQPCPAGSSASAPAQASGTDENGVSGSAGDSAPAAVARPLNLGAADPGQRASVCGYLSAEMSRLDYEFQQPLPPPVLDDISTQLANLRTQAKSAGCAAPKPAAAAAASAPEKAAARRRPASRVLNEVQDEQ